ncbi:bifunctional DNA primase/polymerase [Ponticaulis profundi]|uniref:Bifunctional DNA primase/polymerase n=1 Tax=Ponticaulis profundi TaxID=2665222 RepID=A0ABW1SEN6_9PROT
MSKKTNPLRSGVNYENKAIEMQQLALFEDLPISFQSVARNGADGASSSIKAHNEVALGYAAWLADLEVPVLPVWGVDTKAGCSCKYRELKESKALGTPFEPCASPGKHPKRGGWQQYTSTDQIEIRKWFLNHKGRQNIAIATGGQANIIIVDLDGVEGADSYEKLLHEHGDMPETLEIETGSGGSHIILRAPKGVKVPNSASKIAPKIDIRGEGGLAVTAGSLHPRGNYYVFKHGRGPGEVGIAEAPDWLLELIAEGEPSSDPSSATCSADKVQRKPAGQLAAGSWSSLLESQLGDGPDGCGFDNVIYTAMCRYFTKFGANAEADTFVNTAMPLILDADCENERNKTRYATDGYLSEQLEKARAFVRSRHAYVPKRALPLMAELRLKEEPEEMAALLGEHFCMVKIGKHMVMAKKPAGGK